MKYVNEFKDRHGKPRTYFRRYGKVFPLPHKTSDEFDDEYSRLLAMSPTELLYSHKEYSPPEYPDGPTVYFITDQLKYSIKIGFSNRFSERLKAIQNLSSSHIVVLHIQPGTASDEARLHRRFNKCRLHGEWFADLDGQITQYIKEQKAKNKT